MTYLKIAYVLGVFITAALSADAHAKTKYKCMIQMNSYIGEGAYIAVSLIKADNSYDQTLYVLGADKKWYPDLKEWYKAYKKNRSNIDAVTGASVNGGDRAVATFEIEDSKMNAGYKLRFESAVENKGYHITDVEIPLTNERLAAKVRDPVLYGMYVSVPTKAPCECPAPTLQHHIRNYLNKYNNAIGKN